MQRRELLMTAGAAALTALATPANAAEDHSRHQHGAKGKFAPLGEAAADCVLKGQTCLSHCLLVLGDGDKELAACARSVNQMLSVCTALQGLAQQNSKYTAGFAKAAIDVCKDCEDECRKHEKKHAECKACAESCAACLKQCKALSA